MPTEIITSRLVFRVYDEPGVYAAVDGENVEYFVRESYDTPGCWSAAMRRRVTWNSVSQGLGTYATPEEACWACDEADPAELGTV